MTHTKIISKIILKMCTHNMVCFQYHFDMTFKIFFYLELRKSQFTYILVMHYEIFKNIHMTIN